MLVTRLMYYWVVPNEYTFDMVDAVDQERRMLGIPSIFD